MYEYVFIDGKILKEAVEAIWLDFMIMSSLLQWWWFILDDDVQLK